MKLKIDGTEVEVDKVMGCSLPLLDCDDGCEYYVAADAETAGQVARERWKDMAENDPKEFTCMVGEDTLIAWALGQPGGHAGCSCFEDFLDLIETVPEEEFASYDGCEIDVSGADAELTDELGFTPTVAYRAN